jgi:hypothetical protein
LTAGIYTNSSDPADHDVKNGAALANMSSWAQTPDFTIVNQQKNYAFEIYFSLLALYHIERSDTRECETSQAIA